LRAKISNPLQLQRFIIAFETGIILLTNFLMSYLRFGLDWKKVFFEYPGQPKIMIYPILWLFGMYSVHAWDRGYFREGSQFFSRILDAAWRTLLIFGCFVFLIKFPISRVWLGLNIISTVIGILIFRWLIRFIFFRNEVKVKSRKYLYIGTSESKDNDLSEFEFNYGFTPQVECMEPANREAVESWLIEYSKKINRSEFYGVIVGYGQIQDPMVLRIIADLERNHISDFLLISKISPLVNRMEVEENPTLVRIRETQLVGSGAVLKRLFDIVFSSIMLILLLPAFILISLFVKITSPGPVLYIDKRVGQNGELFDFPKFRSMYVGSDKKRLEILGRPDENMSERYKEDPRITPFGRVIRRWSLDEIPQFYSVFRGSMSVVGPRPVLREELAQIKFRDHIRFLAKPGLTGLWQVTGRKEVSWNDRMLKDISYIEQWSLSKDLLLIIKTIKAILTGYGAS